jgi:hypothetical protein
MKRMKTLFPIIAILALCVGLFAQPASAAPGAGTVAFTCTASLPNFPAPNGTNGTCNGTATGVVVTAGGAQTQIQGSFNASFSYNEPVATCPAQGTANGTFSIGGGQITGSFSWQRVGATAVITLSNVNGGGLTGGTGASVAAFESPNAVTNCLAGGGALTATVAGTATVADSN